MIDKKTQQTAIGLIQERKPKRGGGSTDSGEWRENSELTSVRHKVLPGFREEVQLYNRCILEV